MAILASVLLTGIGAAIAGSERRVPPLVGAAPPPVSISIDGRRELLFPPGTERRVVIVLPTCRHCHAVLDSLATLAASGAAIPAGIVILTPPQDSAHAALRAEYPALSRAAGISWGTITIADAQAALRLNAVPLFARADTAGVIRHHAAGVAALGAWMADTPTGAR